MHRHNNVDHHQRIGYKRPGWGKRFPDFVVVVAQNPGISFDMDNYRRYYANYFNIVIPQDYVIHHIDHNRDNNNIENLILLPKDLHQQLHNCCRPDNMVDCNDIFQFLKCDNHLLDSVRSSYLEIVSSVYKELQYWAACKELEMYKRKGMVGPMPFSYKQFYKNKD